MNNNPSSPPAAPSPGAWGNSTNSAPSNSKWRRPSKRAIEQEHHVLVEAGTGVGKSFAYLLPAIDYAVRKKKRVIVSTHTISLQEQLVEKDIPLIQSVYPQEFSAVLVKGRSNYLCQRRLEQARAAGDAFRSAGATPIAARYSTPGPSATGDGSLADLPQAPQPGVWERICAEHGNCLGKRCNFYDRCFWQAAKRRMQTGDLLIVNHALFFSDLALRISGVNYLPKYDLVILDEAHTVEDVAAEHFGLGVSENTLKHQLRVLYDTKRGKGLLSTHGSAANDAIGDIVDLQSVTEDYFERWIDWQQTSGRSNGRIHEPAAVQNDVSPKLRQLSLHIKTVLASVEEPEEISELNAMAEKTALLADELDAIVQQKMPDAVYWMEMGSKSRRNVSLRAAPVNVAAGLRTHLFQKIRSVTLCSATLCTGHASEKNGEGNDPAFSYIISRLGCDGARTLALGSPFDYAKQATLYIESDLPQPSDECHFLSAACEKILQYVRQTSGGAFVLFTSYQSLAESAQRLRGPLEESGIPLLVQGRGVSRKMLLEQFRNTPNAALFGTSSFWQGIDVRGEALRNVIIVKLPFSVPDEPLVQARLEAITRAGGNAFMQYSVPEAIMRLKQGFGRLIRCKTDTGIVVILDSRIKTKRYGRLFLDALPACGVVVRPDTGSE